MDVLSVAFLKFLIIAYVFFALVVIFILSLIRNIYQRLGSKRMVRFLSVISFLLITPTLIVSAAIFDAYFIEPNWIETKSVTIKHRKMPFQKRDFKIVFISDLHVESNGLREESLIRKVNALNPDIVLVGGDLVGNKQGVDWCRRILRKFKTAHGVYIILGNIDLMYFKEDEIIKSLEGSGATILKNEHILFDFGDNNKFWLVGISWNHSNQKDLAYAFSGIPPNDFVVMLTHDPNLIDSDEVRQNKPDLILAGHTHGGQFGVPFIRKYSDYAERSKYMSGFFNVSGIQLYVTRGIGLQTRPIRFLCRPEITVVKLEHSE